MYLICGTNAKRNNVASLEIWNILQVKKTSKHLTSGLNQNNIQSCSFFWFYKIFTNFCFPKYARFRPDRTPAAGTTSRTCSTSRPRRKSQTRTWPRSLFTFSLRPSSPNSFHPEKDPFSNLIYNQIIHFEWNFQLKDHH